MSHLAIDDLYTASTRLHWYRRWFFPSKMQRALESYKKSDKNNESSLQVCATFLHETWIIQRWFFSFFSDCLVKFSISPLVRATKVLNTRGLLTGEAAQANFNAVAGHQNPGLVAEALKTLNTAGLLTGEAAQANCNAVLTTHSGILLDPEMLIYWNRIPAGRLTSERFHEIIRICQAHTVDLATGRRRVIDYINREILNITHPNQNQNINTGQSTHTASVHESVSKSASNLMERYGKQIERETLLDETIVRFSNWLANLADASPKVMAAKRGMTRLSAPDYVFTDPSSQVSTKKLLALLWIALHDEAVRAGSLEDARSQLIEGLYESQRGYNLSETGVDDCNPTDKPICTAGTFNKMLEKGQGLHPDIQILFVSNESAALKYPKVVEEAAMTYLMRLSASVRAEQLDAIRQEESTVEPIWNDIKGSVTEKMFAEFGSLWGNDRNSAVFLNFLETAIYVRLSSDNLETLKQQTSSPSPETGAASVATLGFFKDSDSKTEDGTLDSIQHGASVNSLAIYTCRQQFPVLKNLQ